jgi:AhpC/TSA family
MYPYERSLVDKLRNEPFAMIGVNSDPSTEVLEQTTNNERLNWRNFFDGGPHQPIARAWNVSAWPTIYLIDPAGTIRYRNLRGEACTAAIELLLAEQSGTRAFGSEIVAQYSTDSLMWSGTPRSIIRMRRNRRFPAHTGWCLNTTKLDELAHTAQRHQEVANRFQDRMESLNRLKANMA